MKKSKTNIGYLAIPYTWNPELSFRIANKIASQLMSEGYIIFSPISHSHPISEYIKDKQINHDFWMHQDLPILKKCSYMILVHIGKNGEELIRNSRGCQKEIEEAKKLGIPIIERHYYYITGELGKTSMVSKYKSTNNDLPKEKGTRHNNGKLMWSLIDFDSLENMVKIMEKGAQKYGKENWKKGLPLNEVIESLLRHTFALLRGEMKDEESKLSHGGHILCNAMFIEYIIKNKPEFNNLLKDDND